MASSLIHECSRNNGRRVAEEAINDEREARRVAEEERREEKAQWMRNSIA